MRITALLIVSLLFMAMKNNSAIKSHHSKDFIADSILQKISNKLNSLTTISYDYKKEVNYSSQNYHAEQTASVYLDLKSNDTAIGCKYQIENEDWKEKQIFNGTEKFELNEKEKTIKINNQPNKNSFNGMSFLYNSIVTLKNVLPGIIANKAIPKTLGDTTLNNISFYIVSVSFIKKGINPYSGSFDTTTMDRNLIYKIIVDKKSDLPVQVIVTNNINNDFTRTSFINITVNKPEPSELSWYYSTYTQYKPAKQKGVSQLIPVGSHAPDWTLPLYNKNEIVALSDFKGKVILLDFWIKNCGHCIESVPELNAIQDKFKNKKFEILGINSYDSKEDIAWFCNKHKLTYKVLMNGKDLADKYGVSGFPMLILIDKSGKVLYSGIGIDKIKVEELIETSL